MQKPKGEQAKKDQKLSCEQTSSSNASLVKNSVADFRPLSKYMAPKKQKFRKRNFITGFLLVDLILFLLQKDLTNLFKINRRRSI